MSSNNVTKYSACHVKWHASLILVAHETSFTMRGATGITFQPHQILRLPRKIALQNLREICRKRLKRHLQWRTIRAWSEHDPTMNSSSRTRPFAEVTFHASDTHFLLKITTFHAPAIYPDFTEYCACHKKWHSNITKCCACHEKWHSKITKYCACHKKWPSKITKCCACHEKWPWTVTWLHSYLNSAFTKLLLAWAVTTELLLDWTVTWLSCYFTALFLYWTVTWLNWYFTELLLYWAVTLLNCYLTELLLYWAVTLLSCYFTELLL